MPLTRRQLLASAAAVGASSLLTGRALAAAPPRNLIVVLAFGGWDAMRLSDPKPGVAGLQQPAGQIGWYGALPVWLPRQAWAVPDFFAAHGDKVCVINGINARSIAHVDCLRRMLTGSTDPAAPDLAAIVAHELGQASPIPYLLLGERGLPGHLGHLAGRIGLTGQLTSLTVPADARPPLDRSSREHDDALEAYLARRAAAAAPEVVRDRDALDEYTQARHRAQLARASELGQGTMAHGSFRDELQCAVDALDTGFSRSVLVDTRIDWDHHRDVDRQDEAFDTLFTELDRLVGQLEARPGQADGATLFDETAVVVLSEMGRTPRYNGASGRDHWPYTSMMVMGGGIAGGRVLGGTDERLIGVPVDLATGAPDPRGDRLSAAAVIAGLLDLLGVDPEPWLPGTTRLSLPRLIDAPEPFVPGPFEETGLRYRRDPCRNDDSGNGNGDSGWSSDSADDDSGTRTPCDSGLFDSYRRRARRPVQSLRGPNGSARPGSGTALQSTVARPDAPVRAEVARPEGAEPLPTLLERLRRADEP